MIETTISILVATTTMLAWQQHTKWLTQWQTLATGAPVTAMTSMPIGICMAGDTSTATMAGAVCASCAVFYAAVWVFDRYVAELFLDDD